MFSINTHGHLHTYRRPAVMGIINATPDSFYAASRAADNVAAGERAEQMAVAGADMIDVGACSTRPGAALPDAAAEWARLEPALRAVRAAVGDALPVSVDTFRAEVARRAVESGLADIVNDVGGCTLDEQMEQTVVELRVPYIMMHMRGTPADMQQRCDYPDGVAAAVISELAGLLGRLTLAGVPDIIIDPGFGFAKTVEQNYRLLRDLPVVADALRRPVLVGMSRKSMATRLLGISAADALPATAALNMLALERGAAVLRVHDVAEAVQVVRIYCQLNDIPV
ncbi:MAG: dihydropteroate synthase [Muribaculaceae bacterium]|nr:dihydropteroate synthase [Muribaculaceae bacterium]